MDWASISWVAGASGMFILNFMPITRGVKRGFDNELDILIIALSCILTTCAIIGEVMLGYFLYLAVLAILGWGIGNFLLSVGVATTIIGGPFLAKPLVIKVLVGVPHYIKKFFADCKKYKAELEIKAPIKRSVYELMEDK